jgi:hypothetical protein
MGLHRRRGCAFPIRLADVVCRSSAVLTNDSNYGGRTGIPAEESPAIEIAQARA